MKPTDLGIWEEISREQERIKIKVETKRFRKLMTVIEGFDPKRDLKEMTKFFKKKLACGGTYKDGKIELQGDHREKVKELLIKQFGYREDQIDMI